MTSPEKLCEAAKLKAEQQKRKKRIAAQQNARREKAVNDERCFEVGRIVCRHFPELRKYQPRCGDATSDAVHDELVAIVDFLAANKELLAQIKAVALGVNSKGPGSQAST